VLLMPQNDGRCHSTAPAGASTGSNAGEVLKVADRGCGGCESLGIEDDNRYNLILALESHKATRRGGKRRLCVRPSWVQNPSH
jgi:hypothetical protein